VGALQARYSDAQATAAARGASARLQAFEDALTRSQAVVNVDLGFLFALMTDGVLYASYRMQVEAGLRPPAPNDWDRQRAGVDAILFGTYDREIRYTALALDGAGLPSYGEFSLTLRESNIADRTSLLDENAYDFVQRHGLTPFTSFPPGHIAPWEDRAKLGVAKLAAGIDGTTDEPAFPGILLWSEGDRTTDRFIEVHIFGPFGRYTVASIRGVSDRDSRSERAKLAAVKDFLASTGGVWIEP
jgi:hypothetical protein